MGANGRGISVRRPGLDAARKRLLERADAVRSDIARELGKLEHEHYSELAGAITDAGEESVAHLLVDVNLAEITRDVEELRGLEAALARIGAGTYGSCDECGAEIDARRLTIMPAAARCVACQTKLEAKDRREHHRTI